MLQIQENQGLDYASIVVDPVKRLRLIRIMMEGLTSRPKTKAEKVQDVVNLFSAYGFNHSQIMDMIKAVDGSNKVVKINKINKSSRAYKNIKNHFDFLHGHDSMESWITIAHIDYALAEDGFHQWHYTHSHAVDVLATLRGKKTNTYMSVNEFWSPYRNVLSLRYITSFYVDIDAHDDEHEFDLKAVKKFLQKKYKNGVLPPHSKMSFTGRGVQLYWKIELSPASNLWLWNIIQRYIVEALEDIKDHVPGHQVDKNCTDITRIFRVDDTWNLKGQCYSKNVDQNDNIYRMNKFLEDFFKDKYTARKKRKNSKKDETRLDMESKSDSETKGKTEWILELNDKIEAKFQIMRQRRCQDLRTLLELRQNQIQDGHREYFLFIYAWTAVENITTENMIYRELASVNAMFADPLGDREVRSIARKVFRKWSKRLLKVTAAANTWSSLTGRYTFRNSTIIEKLDITEEERKHFVTILYRDEAKIVWNNRRNENKRKARRDADGNLLSRITIQERRSKVKELMDLGYGYKRIATVLGISPDTAKNDVRALKK